MPTVAQLGLSFAQVPFAQLPLQHAPFDEQPRPSAVHWTLAQVPLMQLVLQQSTLFMHGAPAVAQLLGLASQVWFAPHRAEQQSAAPAQDWPYIAQLMVPPPPPVPPLPPLSSPHPTTPTRARISARRMV
ncbi:MAG TPA: hypothetical protein VKN99_26320 [Polyangia bacterium]|nr:hypothetical protein [Polyangia bacterium]